MIGERKNVRTRTRSMILYAFLSLFVADSRLYRCVMGTACMSVALPARALGNAPEMNGTLPSSDAA